MAAQNYDLDIEQGSAFKLELQLKQPDGEPLNLSGCTAASQIRKSARSKNPIIDFTCEVVAPTADGIILISLTHDQTSSLSFSNALYDIEVTFATGEVRRLLMGSVRLSPEITR
jgi:hypothetical protein